MHEYREHSFLAVERQRASLALITPPTSEPITLDEAKRHLRLEDDFLDDDELITSLIQAAREHCENATSRAFLTQTWRLSLERFPLCDTIDLPKPTVAAIQGFSYIDGSGAQIDYTTYTLDTTSFPQRIVRNYGLAWPLTRCQRNAVMIMFTAGATTAASVPASIKQAMKLCIGHWYENREAVVVGVIPTSVPMAVDALLAPHRFVVAA